MAGELLSSKIVVQEEEPRIPALPVIQTAVLGALGKAARGPLNTPTQVTSYEEFARTFGEFVAGFELPLAVRSFFIQGGRTAYVVRAGSGGTAASRIATAGTDSQGTVLSSIVGPYNLEPGDTIVVSVNGGGSVTATFNATAGSVTSSNTAPFALANNDTLTVRVDGGGVQTVTFLTSEFGNIAAATAAEVAAVINAKLNGAKATVSTGAIVITSDKRGTSSSIEVTGGTANTGGKLNIPTAVQNGTGNVANIDSVTATEVATVIDAAVAGLTAVVEAGAVRLTSDTAGALSSVQVLASSSADDEIGFDNAVHSGSASGVTNSFTATATSVGTWGNGLRHYIRPASSGVVSEFNYEIELDGLVVERFPNVQVATSSAANYLSTVVNNAQTGSLYVSISVTSTTRPNDQLTGVFLTGGAEPTVTNTELIGDTSPSLTGIRAFDTVPNVTLLVCPDGATVAVQNAMIAYAEITRNRQIFAILDPPTPAPAATILSHVASLTASENAAIYWPRVKIPNPMPRIYGAGVSSIAMCPSGHIAGLIARNDASKVTGPFTNPAGIEDGKLYGVIDITETDVLREEKRDLVFPKRINPIVFVPNQGFFPDGARTLLGTSNFPSVGERRGVSTIETLAKEALLFAKNKINNEDLRDRVENVLLSIIDPFVRAGCLASKDREKAAFVDVSEQLNNAAVRAQGKLLARIGLATNKPAEFIVLLVSQDTRALQEELLSR